jgi:putative membrane protein
MAVIRTALANERTLLAYARTALALMATGVGLLHFFGESWLVAVGWTALPLGILVLLGGVARYVAVRRGIARSPDDGQ